MKEGWTYKKLGDLYPIVMGKTPPRNIARFWDTKKETNNLWVSIADLSKNEGKEIIETKEYISDEATSNITKVNKGALLVSFKLTLGKMAFAGEDLYTNEAIISLTKREDIDLKFLYYYFSNLDWAKLAAGNEKVKGKTLNKKSLSEIPVVYLPLSEQQRIVSRLDTAFAHIDALKEKTEKQLSEARALFQKALEKAMEPKEGWEEKTLKELTTKIGSGATPKGGKKVYINEGTALVRSLNVHNAEFKYQDLAHITKEASEQLSVVELKINDVLFNITGASIARCCVLPGDVLPGRVNQHVAILRPIKEKILPKFLCLGLLSSSHQEELLSIGIAGSTRQALTKADLEAHVFSIPSIDEQQRIVSRLDALSANVRKLEEVLRKTLSECDALKQALLRKVFE